MLGHHQACSSALPVCTLSSPVASSILAKGTAHLLSFHTTQETFSLLRKAFGNLPVKPKPLCKLWSLPSITVGAGNMDIGKGWKAHPGCGPGRPQALNTLFLGVSNTTLPKPQGHWCCGPRLRLGNPSSRSVDNFLRAKPQTNDHRCPKASYFLFTQTCFPGNGSSFSRGT